METSIPVELGRIAQDLQIRRVQVESVVALLDEGNTVPFITRYRKERTGGLDEGAIREVQARITRARELAERKATILKVIESQGKLSEDLAEAIKAAETAKRLEDLYLPYKPKKRTKAGDAREKGLEPLALRIWNRDESLIDLNAAAAEFVDPAKGLETPEQVLEGVGHILAESISELANVRETIRRIVWRLGKITTARAENVPDAKANDYRDYFEYSEPAAHVPPHRILAFNRGDKERVLKVRVEVPREELERTILGQLPLEGHPHREPFAAATLDALDRLLMPSLEREVRRDLTEVAERHAVEVFARNLRSLLLQPPIRKQTVLAIDPGFRSGCKVVVLDPDGALLDHATIHPHQPQNRRFEAKQTLKDLVGKHGVDVVAVGNGTACRETEELVAELIAEGTHFQQNPGVPFPGSEAAVAAEARSAEAQSSAEPPATEPEAQDQSDAGTTDPATAASPENGDGGTYESAPGSTALTEAGVEAALAESIGESSSDAPATDSPEVSPSESSNPEDPGPERIESESPAVDSEVTETPKSEGEPAPSLGLTPDESTPPEQFPPVSGGSDDDEESPPAPQSSESPAPAEAVVPDMASTETAPASDSSTQGTETPGGEAPEPAPIEASPAEAGVMDVTTAEAAPQAVDASEAEPTAEGPIAEGSEGEAPVIEPTAESAPEADPTAASTDAPADSASQPQSGPVPNQGGRPPAPAASFAQPPKGPKPSGTGEPKPAKKDRERRPSKPKGPPPPPKPHEADERLAKLSYVIVNEAGASVYSASVVGKEEFPEHEAEQRGTVSIGRRLQDPLAELVKIEPQSVGVGLYQHDVNPKLLKESLESVIESCVNFVGVDLNSASVPLLQRVSGLNAATARRIFDRRSAQGPFSDRSQLMEVEGIGPASYTQAAGFLKVRDGSNPLDNTWVHPESYEATTKLLAKLDATPADLTDKAKLETIRGRFNDLDPAALAAELELGEPTVRDILDALARPGRDPREDLPEPIFKRGVLKLEDLAPEMELKGTVLNVVDFGAFVDIGLKDSGLVHISQLANRYIKSPHEVVSVGDVVTIWVMGVDPDRKRVSLTMVHPGTERVRPERGGGGPRRAPRGGPGEGQGGGGPGGPPPNRGAGRGRAPGGPGGPGRGGPRPPRSEGGPEGASPSREGSPSSAPRPGTNRIPGPPMRAQQGQRGGGRFGRAGGMGGPGRGGPGGPGRGARGPSDDNRDAPAAPKKPKAPTGPPPPLSTDAITGSTPLRSFGQLKQLFETRQEPEAENSEGQPPRVEDQSGGTPPGPPDQGTSETTPPPSEP